MFHQVPYGRLRDIAANEQTNNKKVLSVFLLESSKVREHPAARDAPVAEDLQENYGLADFMKDEMIGIDFDATAAPIDILNLEALMCCFTLWSFLFRNRDISFHRFLAARRRGGSSSFFLFPA